MGTPMRTLRFDENPNENPDENPDVTFITKRKENVEFSYIPLLPHLIDEAEVVGYHPISCFLSLV